MILITRIEEGDLSPKSLQSLLLTNLSNSSISNIVRAYVLPVNANGQAINYYNFGSIAYSTLRTPIISFISKTSNSYTINISNSYSSSRQSGIIYIINTYILFRITLLQYIIILI
jgi:hypothetical protein